MGSMQIEVFTLEKGRRKGIGGVGGGGERSRSCEAFTDARVCEYRSGILYVMYQSENEIKVRGWVEYYVQYGEKLLTSVPLAIAIFFF